MASPEIAACYRWADLPRDRPLSLLQRRRIIGERVMLSEVLLEKGCVVPAHAHDNEQFCCVLSGRLRFGLGAEGSPEHREALVRLAAERSLELGEEGLRGETGDIAAPDEATFFAHLGLQPVPPEVREGDIVWLVKDGQVNLSQLRVLAHDPDREIRTNAVIALGNIGDQSTVDLLIGSLIVIVLLLRPAGLMPEERRVSLFIGRDTGPRPREPTTEPQPPDEPPPE